MNNLQQVGDEIWNFGALNDPSHEGALRVTRTTDEPAVV